MLTYDEHIQLRDKLERGEIDLKAAQEQYWKDSKDGQRSWHTKGWKERRAKLIKDKCEICSSKETLTIQHLSHPKKYSEYLRELTTSYAKDYIGTNPGIDKSDFSKYVLKNYDYFPIAFCPNCNYSRPNERVRKKPRYLCTTCKHEFDSPVYKSVDELISIFFEKEDALEVRDKCFVSKQWRNNNHLSNIKYWFQRERAKSKDDGSIEKEAFLLHLNDSIKYLSFEDTITACRKCAYKFDMQKMELCPKCKEYYKGVQYPTCIHCLPEDRRKAALESIAFGKMMGDMHRDLGID